MNRKNIFLWSLYDFAYSVVFIVFFLYFSQWLVIDHHVSDFWFNMIFVGSTLLLLVTTPVMGSIIDKIQVRMPTLRIVTALGMLFFLIAALIGVLHPQWYVWAAFAFLFATYFYQFAFSIYNPMLVELAPPHKRGLVSGTGELSYWLGNIFGLLITLSFAGGAIFLFGAPGRAQTFLPSVLIFIVLALPMVFFFKEKNIKKDIKINVKEEYKKTFSGLLRLFKTPNVGRFLIAFFFFNDAVITVSNNFPIYLQQVFHVSDSTKSLLLVGILAMSGIGAFLSGLVSDRIGLKKTLMIILGGWIVLFPALAAITNFKIFIVGALIMGLWYGSVWTVTRAMLIHLVPESDLNHASSYYTLAERFSSFIGPLSWGISVSVLYGLGAAGYRISLLFMTVFICIGFLILFKVKDEKVPVKVS